MFELHLIFPVYFYFFGSVNKITRPMNFRQTLELQFWEEKQLSKHFDRKRRLKVYKKQNKTFLFRIGDLCFLQNWNSQPGFNFTRNRGISPGMDFDSGVFTTGGSGFQSLRMAKSLISVFFYLQNFVFRITTPWHSIKHLFI